MKTLKENFIESMSNILRFKLGLDCFEYKKDQQLTNWRDFEAELDVNYPIKGTQIQFGKEQFEKWLNKNDNNLIINSSKDIASFDITNELVGEPFRYKEMTFVYLFTVLEDFGNSILKLINVEYYNTEIEQKGKSWHSKINQFQFNKGKDLTENFARVFLLEKKDISDKYVSLFYELKSKRNSIVHQLKYPNINDFNKDIESIILLMCYLYHINDKLKEDMKIYPWEDYGDEE